MSTGDTQLANNNQEAPSLKEALATGFREIQERKDTESQSSENQQAADSGQGDQDGIRERGQQLEERGEQDGGVGADERHDGEVNRESEDGHTGDEVHNSDRSEGDGQNEGQGLLLESVPEELHNTFKYLKKEDREHLEEAGYDDQTVNQYLTMVKNQNDSYQKKSLDVAQLKKVFEPYADALAKAGITEAQQTAQYVQWHQGILNNPKEGMIQLASSLGFNLEELIGGKQSGNNAEAVAGESEQFQDPATTQISEINARLDANDDRARQEVDRDALNSINTFKNQKDGKGNAMHPHFDRLGPLIAQEIASGAKDLQAAYDTVLKDLNLPAVDRGNGQAAQNDGKARPAKKSIKRAKQAASGVKSTSVARTREAPGSMKNELAVGVKAILNRR